jgi:protease PrsW
MNEILLRIGVGLLPVLCFLAALVAVDSYKLVKLPAVLATVGLGMGAAAASYLANAFLLAHWAIGFTHFTRYVAPAVEELAKGLVIVALVRSHRIAFLVDAAICGFAVGAGFAMVENLHYLAQYPGAGMATWNVRGFGTAIMHGGASAIFAIVGIAMLERAGRASVRAFLPGLVFAVALHSAFNHFFLSPRLSTLGIAVLLPPLLYAVFERSEAAVGRWLGSGFDADTEMLELINSGRFGDSRMGLYLHALKDKFRGPVVADILCYLRLHTELALRAKGILMMRESGFAAPADASTREKFAELRFLEASIGATALRAIQPMLHMSNKDLWQLYMLGK